MTGCPWQQITNDVWRAIDAVGRLRRGHGWPVAGGWLDQSHAFLQVLDMVDQVDPPKAEE